MTMDDPRSNMTLLGHLEELRRRILAVVVLWLAAAAAGYALASPVIRYLAKYAPSDGLYFFSVTEAFMVQLKVAVTLGGLAVLPFILYQIGAFVRPALSQREQALIAPALASALLLFLGGGAFCYFLICPPAIKFLLGIAGPGLTPLLSVGKYLSFIIWLTVSFGLAFQLPVVVVILARLGLVRAAMLRRRWRTAYFLAFLVAALGPTVDVFSQLAMAVPLIVLYEVSIVIARLVEPKIPKGLDTPPIG